jgi:putative DNA primase/helicase
MGETVRVVDVPADAGRGWGIFDEIPADVRSSEELVRRLKSACEANHGHAKRAFLHRMASSLQADEELLRTRIEKKIDYFVDQHLTGTSPGVSHRIAKKFGLAYAAGVVAIKFKVLPYSEADVFAGISACYQAAVECAPKSLEDELRAAQKTVKAELAKGSPLDLATRYPAKDLNAAVLLKATVDGEAVIGMRGKRLRQLVPDRRVQSRLIASLESEGSLLPGVEGPTRAIQVQRKGGKQGSVRCYCFRARKLK